MLAKGKTTHAQTNTNTRHATNQPTIQPHNNNSSKASKPLSRAHRRRPGVVPQNLRTVGKIERERERDSTTKRERREERAKGTKKANKQSNKRTNKQTKLKNKQTDKTKTNNQANNLRQAA